MVQLDSASLAALWARPIGRDTIVVENHIHLPAQESGGQHWYQQRRYWVSAALVLVGGGVYCAFECRSDINVNTVVRVGGR